MNRILIAIALLLAAGSTEAACVNKYVSRQEGSKQIVTLLTGMLTYDEATALAEAIRTKSATPIEWVDAGGKTITRQLGELKVVRPMPIACDGKPSGVVLNVSFLTVMKPAGTIRVKLSDSVVVAFEQQG